MRRYYAFTFQCTANHLRKTDEFWCEWITLGLEKYRRDYGFDPVEE